MKKTMLTVCCLLCLGEAIAENYHVKTQNTMMVLNGEKGSRLNFVYYGPTASTDDIYATGNAIGWGAYPTFGTHCTAEHALLVQQAEGDNALELTIEDVRAIRRRTGTSHMNFCLKTAYIPYPSV